MERALIIDLTVIQEAVEKAKSANQGKFSMLLCEIVLIVIL